MSKHCAICGKTITRYYLCKDHYLEYCCDPAKKFLAYPEWVEALIKMQTQFDYEENHKIVFSDLGMKEKYNLLGDSIY